MKNLLIVNDTFDQQNWGAQAGAYALNKIFSSNSTQPVNIKSLSYSWMEERYLLMPKWFGGKIISYNRLSKIEKILSNPISNLPVIADEFEFIANMWLKNKDDPIAKKFIDICKNIDVVVLNGEGSMYRNNYTAIKGLFLLWFANKKLSIPAYFLNGSVNLTRVDPILPAMVGKTFMQINQVAVREPWSQRNINKFYPKISVDVIPDSVFYLFDEINKTPVKSFLNQQFCAFSPPMLITAIKNVYRSSKEYSLLYKLVIDIKKIVPQVVILAKEPRDMVLKQLAEDTNSIFFGPSNSVDDLVALLRQASLLISGRYHHLIIASILGIPCIPMATTSHKVHGLSELFEDHMGVPHDCTDIENESAGILEKVSKHFGNNNETGNSLQMIARKLSRESLKFNRVIDNL